MKAVSFEEALKKLESIASQLENGKLPLEKSLQLYEEGVSLIRYCNKVLKETERKIEKLVETSGGASIETFEEEKTENGE